MCYCYCGDLLYSCLSFFFHGIFICKVLVPSNELFCLEKKNETFLDVIIANQLSAPTRCRFIKFKFHLQTRGYRMTSETYIMYADKVEIAAYLRKFIIQKSRSLLCHKFCHWDYPLCKIWGISLKLRHKKSCLLFLNLFVLENIYLTWLCT